MILPQRFANSMKKLLNGEYDDLIASYDEKPLSGLRVNTSKISLSDFESIAPFDIDKIPYISDGYYINDTDAWSKHPYYYAGLYYLQEPSAMLPAEILPVSEGDTVLDLCAAPGGKSTKLAVKQAGLLFANDISPSRAIALVKNLEHFGTGNYLVSAVSPKVLASNFRETFSSVLVDAPCSGEGMFRKDKSLISSYSKVDEYHYPNIQKAIIESAWETVCPGGFLLYSTCTFSDTENEKVIQSLLDGHDDAVLCPVDDSYGLSGPYEDYAGMNCYHLFPHRQKGEGHFIALIKKSGAKPVREDISFCDHSMFCPELEELMPYMSEGYRKRFRNRSFLKTQDGFIYMLPEKHKGFLAGNIRYLRTGTCIGRIQKSGKVQPSTAFALSLSPDDLNNVLSLRADDPDIIRYLKGETLIIGKDRMNCVKKGLVLICVDRFPLGFGKYDGNKIKNLYEKGWVMS